MSSRLIVNQLVSIKQDILPFVKNRLDGVGWALLQIENSSDKLESDMLIIASIIGQSLAINMGYHIIQGDSSDEHLPAHTEGISNTSGIIPYFALGCITPSRIGGETRIFDGRLAARKVDSIKELSGVTIEYTSLANPEECVDYPLVCPDFGRTLRYRSKVVTNRVICSGNLSENEMYQKVDSILEESLMPSHSWSSGELLFVNNLVTIHDRFPFSGVRSMLRIRYDDQINSRVRY